MNHHQQHTLNLPNVPQHKRLWHDAIRDKHKLGDIVKDKKNGENRDKNEKRNASFLRARKVHQQNKTAKESSSSKYVLKDDKCLKIPYMQMMRDSWSVAQELALVMNISAFHKALLNDVDIFCEYENDHNRGEEMRGCTVEDEQKILIFSILTFSTLLVVVVFSKGRVISDDQAKMKNNLNDSARYLRDGFKKILKIKRMFVRLCDLVLLAAILRLLSSLMRSLTASFSSDTVSTLVTVGWIAHLLACDYDYANGKGEMKAEIICSKNGSRTSPTRQKFKGGYTSLSGALLSVTLLASRLSSDVHAFTFVSTSIIAFAFYPEHRANLARYRSPFPTLYVTSGLCGTALMTLEMEIRIIFVFSLLITCLIIPGIKFWLQQYKAVLIGPWTVVQVPSVEEYTFYENDPKSKSSSITLKA